MNTYSLPMPVPTGLNYYTCRAQDYITRHSIPDQGDPPTYYLHYGDKYCHRFCVQLRPWLSPAGQQWVDRTCLLLQQAIEHALAHDPIAFARLEENSEAFYAWAYATHAAAYIEGGITHLPLRDLFLILYTIDLKDLITSAGLRQVWLVLLCFLQTYRQITRYAQIFYRFIAHNEKDSYSTKEVSLW
jgi:hypothetical protein